MLQNAYLVAKIGVDTAENEPSRKSDVSWLTATLLGDELLFVRYSAAT